MAREFNALLLEACPQSDPFVRFLAVAVSDAQVELEFA